MFAHVSGVRSTLRRGLTVAALVALPLGLGLSSAGAASPSPTPTPQIGCPADVGTASYPASSATVGTSLTDVTIGTPFTVTTAGFDPLSQVAYYLCPSKLALYDQLPVAAKMVMPDGTASRDIVLPADTPLGDMVLQARGVDGTARLLVVSTHIRVDPAPAAATPAPTPSLSPAAASQPLSAGTNGRSAPSTDSQLPWLLAGGAALLVVTAGSLLTALGRRRAGA